MDNNNIDPSKREDLNDEDWKGYMASNDRQQQLFALDHFQDNPESISKIDSSQLSNRNLVRRLFSLLEDPYMSEEVGKVVSDIFAPKGEAIELLVSMNGIPTICKALERELIPPYLAEDMLRILKRIAQESHEYSEKIINEGGIEALSTIFLSEIAEIEPKLTQTGLRVLLPLCESHKKHKEETLKKLRRLIPTLIRLLFSEDEKTLDLTLQCFERLEYDKEFIQIIIQEIVATRLMQLSEKPFPISIRKRALSILDGVFNSITEEEYGKWFVKGGKMNVSFQLEITLKDLENLLILESDDEISRSALGNLGTIASRSSCPFENIERTIEYVGNEIRNRYPEGIQFLHNVSKRESLTPSEV